MDKAEEIGVSLPGTKIVAQMFAELAAAGEDGLDHIAIVKILERMAGVEARAKK
jgi:3-hydroxyisobutyrate dehydrogenase-like beta-hydroxyacid dehydrogenase